MSNTLSYTQQMLEVLGGQDVLGFIHKLKAENEKLKSEVVTLQASEAENEDWQLAARSADWSETPEELCDYLTYCGDPDEYNQLLGENKELKAENEKLKEENNEPQMIDFYGKRGRAGRSIRTRL
tara:strand:- start:4576 stop:4950 length:375 start_codon:yes stop_codon:yes gene_type:complete